MNIFNKYGIKEVADVTFYSIIRIDSEEFYLPVLYFDTLKTSAFTPEAETNTAYGGYGNQMLLSWGYNRGWKLKLEDALFSETSLNMALNGRAMAKLTKWTSALAKINVANHYGQKHYSTEAYPSPELTRDEWEIIYQCAQDCGFNSIYGDIEKGIFATNSNNPTERRMNYVYQDGQSDKYIAENRWNLMNHYFNRDQPTAYLKDFSPYVDFDKTMYNRITMIAVANNTLKDLQAEKANSQELESLKNGQELKITRKVRIAFSTKENPTLQYKRLCQLSCIFYKYNDTIKCTEARLEKLPDDTSPSNLYYPTNHIGNEFFLDHALYFCFPNYLGRTLRNTHYEELKQINYSAMPSEIVNKIIDKITAQTQLGNFNNDLSTINSIDRFETCVVPEGSDFKIDIFEQKKNLQKFYNNEEDNYVIFYDKKTMLPFIKNDDLIEGMDENFYEQKAVEVGFPQPEVTKYRQDTWNGSEADITMSVKKDTKINSPAEYNIGDYSLLSIFKLALLKRYQWSLKLKPFIRNLSADDFIITKMTTNPTRSSIIYYFKVTKRMYLKLRPGTPYFKRSKTIDDRTNFDSFLGTNITLDPQYFSGEFLITGETLIRNQKSGKDEHVQLLVNRASFANPTALNIQVGQPQVFSFEMNILKPKNDKPALEIRKYQVEDDRYNGGKKIVPQSRNHVFTTFLDDEADTHIGENKPIY